MINFKYHLSKVVFAAAFVFALMFNCTISFADSSSMGRGAGETVYPLNNSDIRMASEEVNIKVLKGAEYFTTSCNFKFVNDSNKTVSVLMGFPDGDSKIGDQDPYLHMGEDMQLKDFETYVNNIPLKVQRELGQKVEKGLKDPMLGWPYWYTWIVEFKPHETKYIKNTYKVDVNNDFETGAKQVGYVLNTGKPWKGNIGYAKVVIDFTNVKEHVSAYCSPTATRSEKNKFVWEFKNFEPDSPRDYINVNFLIVNNKQVDRILSEATFDLCIGSNKYYHTGQGTSYLPAGLQYVDSSNKSAAPYMKNNTIFVPANFMAKILGMTVSWDASKNQIIMQKKEDISIYDFSGGKSVDYGKKQVVMKLALKAGSKKLDTTNIDFLSQNGVVSPEEFKKFNNTQKQIQMPVAPEIVKGTIYVPLKKFVELASDSTTHYIFYKNGLALVTVNNGFSDLDGFKKDNVLIDALIKRFKQLKLGQVIGY